MSLVATQTLRTGVSEGCAHSRLHWNTSPEPPTEVADGGEEH
jgi:hypothetical protein